jgi:hypothetical protein
MPINAALVTILCSGAASCALVASISPLPPTKLVILSVAKDLHRSIATPQNWSWILESRTAA